jgi:hypothetical protein
MRLKIRFASATWDKNGVRTVGFASATWDEDVVQDKVRGTANSGASAFREG